MKALLLGLLFVFHVGSVWAEEPASVPASTVLAADDTTPLEQAEKDITNFHAVDDTVFRGGRPNSVGLQDLVALKVETLIDLEGGDIHGHNFIFNFVNYLREPGEHKNAILAEQKQALKDGIKNFFSIPLNSNDTVSKKEADKIDQILSILHDHEDQPVYVHCQHGKDRTGLIVALYEVKYHHMTPQDAHDEMVAMGHTGALDLLFTGKLDDFFWKVAPGYYSDAQK